LSFYCKSAETQEAGRQPEFGKTQKHEHWMNFVAQRTSICRIVLFNNVNIMLGLATITASIAASSIPLLSQGQIRSNRRHMTGSGGKLSLEEHVSLVAAQLNRSARSMASPKFTGLIHHLMEIGHAYVGDGPPIYRTSGAKR
jgi:hypothetical protein